MAARANKKDKKRCFVIMPIGKEGTPEHEYNLGVYDSIIRPAAESCGYLVTRADLSFQTGNIPKHIIMQLAESELVIADLSERNANVYFELGIRHALARCGTIHVVEESKALPFDVAQYRAIKYSTHFTKIEATKRAIRDVIREKDQTTDASDNPVHDAIALPANYRDRGDEALRARLTALQTRVGELEKQNNDLLKRVADKSILLSEMDEASMEAAIDEAVDRSIKAIENSPVRLILQIREDVAQGKQMEVLESIRAALKSPYLEPEHIATLASIAQVSEMRALQNAVLEVGRLRFPGDIDFKRWLAESYVHSSDIDLKSKGLAILEEHLGISWDKNEVTIGKPFVDEAPGSLVIIADHYHTAEQYDRELALLQAAVKVWPDESKIMRNLARTYRSLGDEKKAEEFFHIALQKNPADDQAMAWFASLVQRQGRLTEAIDLLERASATDPDDHNYPLALGVLILEQGNPRVGDGSAKDPPSSRVELALPYFQTALQTSHNDTRVAMKIAQILSGTDLKAAKAFLRTADLTVRNAVEPDSA